ncbi:YbaB/EbfC family DNA-binding protein [Mycolicibacterium phlei]
MYSHDYEDERDGLAALDFFVTDTESEAAEEHSVLDLLDVFVADAGGSRSDSETANRAGLFVVTNPPGSVTVCASPDGRLQHVELSPRARELTERDLAEEIVVLAGLAATDAKSAQYSAMLEGMRRQGHDDAATRDFLMRDLDLPTPEQAQQERARVFATRYGGDHD